MKRKILFLFIILSFFSSFFFFTKETNVDASSPRNVYDILNDYYNEGVYEKDTIINLSEAGVEDLKHHFHVENHLIRKTYYEKDALWMSQGAEAEGVNYSFYGTAYDKNNPNGVTYATTSYPLIRPQDAMVVLSGDGKNSMEEYYTTLFDILSYQAQWTYNKGVYTAKDEELFGYFLDFTAPCLYGSVVDSNLFSYEKVTIEVNELGELVLKLWVSSIDYGFIEGGKDAVVDGYAVLSQATISHKHQYSMEYSYDEESHWYECCCGVKKDLEQHTFGDGHIYNSIAVEYICESCGYSKYVITEDDLTVGIGSEYGLAIRVPENRDIKIAQFADIHFGVDGKSWHNFNIERTKAFIKDAVKRDRPDLIVCSGDNIIGTGITNDAANAHDLTEFVEFMEQLQIPWTFMYGNHDAETKVKKDYSDFLLNCIATGKTKYLMYEEEYVEVVDKSTSKNDLGRYGNFSIQVLNSLGDKLLGSIILFDAGTYLYDLSVYQSITPGQVAWYEEKINTLQAMYSKQDGNLHDVIPTIVFSHIQLPEHKIAYHEAYYNQTEGYEFVIRQDEVASDFKNVSNQKPNTDSGLFDKMVELGSTKAYFVGHAHNYKFQVKSHGIVLGYAPNTGLSKLDGNGDLPRDLYTYCISNDFSFTTNVTTEVPYEPAGLTYSYCSSEDEYDRRLFNYDEASNTYYGLVDFKQWGKIRLRYNGECLTPDNTTITGDFNSSGVNENDKLYQGNDKTQFVYGTDAKKQIAFTYNATTKVLNIHVVQNVTYEGTHTGTAVYDVLNNRYTFTAALPCWGHVAVKLNGTYITDDNIQGAFYKIGREYSGAQWDRRLYTESTNYSMVCCIGKQGDKTVTNTFQFSYSPVTKKLNVAYSAIGNSVNKDVTDAITIWSSGQYLAKANSYTVSNTQWRYIIVVDAEGRIAFMAYYPASGYGSPYNTNLHYTHSIYKGKPELNPAFELYGDKQYNTIAPEGGFALSAHGVGVTTLLNLLGVSTSNVSGATFKPGVLSDDIRLGYDSSTKTIFVYK